MNLLELDPFSKQFAKALFSEWPKWRDLAVIEQDEDSGGKYLMVSVPSPSTSNLEQPLSVSTYDNEVTVSIDLYHCHLTWPVDFGRDSTVSDPIHLIQLLMNEEQAALTHFEGDRLRSAMLIAREECLRGHHRKRLDYKYLSEANRFRVRSWRGALDDEGEYPS